MINKFAQIASVIHKFTIDSYNTTYGRPLMDAIMLTAAIGAVCVGVYHLLMLSDTYSATVGGLFNK
jgi:hypothetical protein